VRGDNESNAPPPPTRSASESRAVRHGRERRAAHDILRLMASDAAEAVRRATAVTLKASSLLPRDVALKLARDVETVAVPVLNFSPAFSDEDLAELVRGSSGVKQVAVAYAPRGESVTAALAEYGVEEALKIACANDNACFLRIRPSADGERFPHSRPCRCPAYREKLRAASPKRLRPVSTHHNTCPPHGARPQRTDQLPRSSPTKDVSAFAEHLHRSGR
jgi:hypothetical protein